MRTSRRFMPVARSSHSSTLSRPSTITCRPAASRGQSGHRHLGPALTPEVPYVKLHLPGLATSFVGPGLPVPAGGCHFHRVTASTQ